VIGSPVSGANFTLQGYVYDQFGNPLPSATVQITRVDVPDSTTLSTNQSGYFTASLINGIYVVDVSKNGYTHISFCVEGKDYTQTYNIYLFNINWLLGIQSFMDNTNAQIQQVYNLYIGINDNVNRLLMLYQSLSDNLNENLSVICSVLNELLSSQQTMLAMIGSIQNQIQILASGYDQLENRVAYLENQVGIMNGRFSVMESSLDNLQIRIIQVESRIENIVIEYIENITIENITNMIIENITRVENIYVENYYVENITIENITVENTSVYYITENIVIIERVDISENINMILSLFGDLKNRVETLEVWMSAVENNVNIVNNRLNDINNRLFLLEQLLKVPSGFPSYTVKVKLIDENSFDIHDEKIWLIMANGRVLEGVTSPAVFENVLADRVVIRYKDLRYEFVLNSNTNILIQVKENVAQVLTMVRIVIPNLKEGSRATIIVDDGKYSFWTYENAITVWLPVGEHKIQIFTNDQKGETTLYASHEPEEQTLYLQSSTGVLTWVTPLAIAVGVIVLLSLLGLAWAWSQKRYRYRWR
jgi:chaperonin cofactor prefoldin